MYPETKKLTQKKHALSNTNTDRKSKATAKPWFSRLLRHPARKRIGSILGQTHTFTYLLTCPGPTRGHMLVRKCLWLYWCAFANLLLPLRCVDI